MKTTKKHSGLYKVYSNNVFLGTIEKLDTNEWACIDAKGYCFEICQTKKYSITQFNDL